MNEQNSFISELKGTKVLASRIEILDKLQAAPFPLFLTGSHFFGTQKESSDYDFFTDYSPNTEDWLRKNGFNPIFRDTSGYKSQHLIAVFEQGDVQVQLVDNADHKQKIQDVLKAHCHGSLANLCKSDRRNLWNLAYAIFESFNGNIHSSTRMEVKGEDVSVSSLGWKVRH